VAPPPLHLLGTLGNVWAGEIFVVNTEENAAKYSMLQDSVHNKSLSGWKCKKCWDRELGSRIYIICWGAKLKKVCFSLPSTNLQIACSCLSQLGKCIRCTFTSSRETTYSWLGRGRDDFKSKGTSWLSFKDKKGFPEFSSNNCLKYNKNS
jgi:hypothetical protein